MCFSIALLIHLFALVIIVQTDETILIVSIDNIYVYSKNKVTSLQEKADSHISFLVDCGMFCLFFLCLFFSTWLEKEDLHQCKSYTPPKKNPPKSFL